MSSRVPQEWNRGPWVMGNQEAFKDLAASDVFPNWVRVHYAALSRLAANQHATFRQQELAILLGSEVDGIWVPAKRQRVREAIDQAIDRHLLLEGSKALCLIVPRAHFANGAGNPDIACKRHPKNQRNGSAVSPRIETTRIRPVVSPPKERSSRVVSGSAPLSLLVTHPEPHERPAS